MKSKKQIRQDRLWKHFMSFLDSKVFGPDMRVMDGYNPELWRDAFFRYQAQGPTALTDTELFHIHPLIDAQKRKEITLTGLAEESMEWWSKGAGWIYPWLDTINRKPIDRLFKVACMRTMRTIAKDSLGFFINHPGINADLKKRYLDERRKSHR